MAKYYGKIGFAELVEDTNEPGVWVESIKEKAYSGEIIRNSRRLDNSSYLNDNINISNQFSILADPYAVRHINAMRYLTWQGSKWKINNVSVEYPRLTLEVAGIYNDAE